MTPEQFVYWLQGALEIMDPKQLDEKQIQVIKDHIALVLKKETPKRIEIPTISISPVQPGTLTQPRDPYLGGATLLPKCKCAPGTLCGCYLTATC
jgi:hypothetical protein